MIVLGVDIGVHGAIAAVDNHGYCRVEDLPCCAIEGRRMVRRKLVARPLIELVRHMVKAGDVAVAVIEDVHTWPGAENSPQSQGSLMHSRGVVESVMDIARIHTSSVQPAVWKRALEVSSDKESSRDLALRLYPAVAAYLRRKSDHNRAEAILLAHYGHQVMM